MEIYEGKYSSWKIFADHHYLTPKLNKASRIYLGYWNDRLVGCVAVLTQPSGYFDNGMRGTRTVVLPDFQGMGIGSKLSDYVAGSYVKAGYRYFTKTVNPALGIYRNRSEKWKPTSKNGRPLRYKDKNGKQFNSNWVALNRESYCHEFIDTNTGDPSIILHKRK